ncbi:MAG: hypothetical protein QOF92_1407, partial [Pseudonocardiales bacterium]|nr:hypothetical protein [Pseudonocardiales bacterium]
LPSPSGGSGTQNCVPVLGICLDP